MTDPRAVDKIRPEESLARLHTRQPLLIEALMMRIDARADDSVSIWSASERIAQALETNRSALKGLPSDDEVKVLVETVSKALSRCTEAFINRQVAQLIGSYPNANPTDPETFISALVFDLRDSQIPDAILLLACQELRRTSRFVPTIAEVLTTANRQLERWQQVLDIPTRLPRSRERLQAAIQTVEAIRAEQERQRARQAQLELERRHPVPALTRGIGQAPELPPAHQAERCAPREPRHSVESFPDRELRQALHDMPGVSVRLLQLTAEEIVDIRKILDEQGKNAAAVAIIKATQ